MINTQIIAQELRDLIDSNITNLKAIDDHTFENKTEIDKWSKKEILGHLIDSAINNIRRFILTQSKNTPRIVYNQNRWVEVNNYQQWDNSLLIDTWKSSNMHIAQIIQEIPEQSLNRSYKVRDGKKYTLEHGILDYVVHLKHHLNQIY